MLDHKVKGDGHTQQKRKNRRQNIRLSCGRERVFSIQAYFHLKLLFAAAYRSTANPKATGAAFLS